MTDKRSARFELLYRRHYRPVAGYVARRLREDLVADTTQEVFLVAWRRLDDVRDPGIGWFLAIARNAVLERYRVGSRLRSIQEAALDDARSRIRIVGGADDEAIERLSVFEALRRLSEDDQEVLLLTAWEGLDAGTAADVLGCSSGTYRMRLSRARRRFETELARSEHDQSTSRAIPTATSIAPRLEQGGSS